MGTVRIIRWEPLPPAKPGPFSGLSAQEIAEWEALTVALQKRPGEWAVILEDNENKASALRTRILSGSLAPFRPTSNFQVSLRRNPKNRDLMRVFVRFVGDETSREAIRLKEYKEQVAHRSGSNGQEPGAATSPVAKAPTKKVTTKKVTKAQVTRGRK